MNEPTDLEMLTIPDLTQIVLLLRERKPEWISGIFCSPRDDTREMQLVFALTGDDSRRVLLIPFDNNMAELWLSLGLEMFVDEILRMLRGRLS